MCNDWVLWLHRHLARPSNIVIRKESNFEEFPLAYIKANLSPYGAMVLGDEPMNPTRHIDLLTYAIEIEIGRAHV